MYRERVANVSMLFNINMNKTSIDGTESEISPVQQAAAIGISIKSNMKTLIQN